MTCSIIPNRQFYLSGSAVTHPPSVTIAPQAHVTLSDARSSPSVSVTWGEPMTHHDAAAPPNKDNTSGL